MTRFAIYDLVREALSSGKESLPLWKLAVAASIGGGAGGCMKLYHKCSGARTE